MWHPFAKKNPKSRVDSPAWQANPGGRPPATAPTSILKQQAAEVDGIATLVDKVAALNEKLGLFAEPEQEEGMVLGSGGEWAWLGEWAPFIGPVITPYIPGLMERMGIMPREIPTQTTPEQPREAGTQPLPVVSGYGFADIKQMIDIAAVTPEAAIKPFAGTLRDELTKAGIDENKFKLACQKIGRVL